MTAQTFRKASMALSALPLISAALFFLLTGERNDTHWYGLIFIVISQIAGALAMYILSRARRPAGWVKLSVTGTNLLYVVLTGSVTTLFMIGNDYYGVLMINVILIFGYVVFMLTILVGRKALGTSEAELLEKQKMRLLTLRNAAENADFYDGLQELYIEVVNADKSFESPNDRIFSEQMDELLEKLKNDKENAEKVIDEMKETLRGRARPTDPS